MHTEKTHLRAFPLLTHTFSSHRYGHWSLNEDLSAIALGGALIDHPRRQLRTRATEPWDLLRAVLCAIGSDDFSDNG